MRRAELDDVDAGDRPDEEASTLIGVDHPLRAAPTQVVPATLDPLLPGLPLGDMLPDDFEKLLLEIAEEVGGLRDVRQYGLPGQTQDGLDVVGRAPDGSWEGWQGKRYQQFGPADLTKTVTDYAGSSKGFPVSRLVIGIPLQRVTTGVTNRLRELQEAQPDLRIELYDGARISGLLQGRRDIVTKFFGPQTADRFCLPDAPRPHVVGTAPPDQVELADAAVRSPERTSGADRVLAQAAAHSAAGDHSTAAEEYARAAQLLTDAGFHGHADAVVRQQAEALARAGAHEQATRLLSDTFWRLVDAGEDRSAIRLLTDARRLLQAPDGPPGRIEPEPARRLFAYAQAAGALLQHPLGATEQTSGILDDPAEHHRYELARLAALAAETALVDQDRGWLASRAAQLTVLADEHDRVDELLAVRLRLAAADGAGEWEQLLTAARRRQHPRIVCALILARYARYIATTRGAVDAGATWNEAVEQACLDGHNHDAADWVYALRMARVRLQPLTEDVLDEHVLAQALTLRGGRPRLLSPAHDVLGAGLADLHDGKLPAAARALRQQVRISAATGRWQDEHIARSRLTETYQDSGELDLAAAHALTVGDKDLVDELTKAAGERRIDVVDRLDAGPYWERACAMQLTAAQADLLPDTVVDPVAERALAVLDAAAAGTLADQPHFFAGPSVFLRAHTLLSELAGRLRLEDARRLFDHLRSYAPREPNHYHYTDDAHVTSLAEVADAHPELREDALDQLLTMISGGLTAPGWVMRRADEALLRHGLHLEPRIAEIAQAGSRHAAQLLADMQDEPDEAQLKRARASLERLTAPVTVEPGRISVGTGAGSDATLVALLPAADRARAARALVDAATGPEPARNRSERILAAAQLAAPQTADRLPTEEATPLLDTALAAAAAAPQPSPADLTMAGLSHPLSAMHVSLGGMDLRPQWTLLAARLATAPEDLTRVREQILTLLPEATGEQAWYLALALQAVPPATLTRDGAILASHPHWAIRSVAALAWAAETDPPAPPALGAILARDPDQRVRRALAEALGHQAPRGRTEEARVLLAGDVRYSVRRLLAV